MISPFVTGFEVDARFVAGDADGALALIHNLWDQMTDKSGPYYTGALWEKLNQDGTDVDSNASLAHGWAGGPVSSSPVLRRRWPSCSTSWFLPWRRPSRTWRGTSWARAWLLWLRRASLGRSPTAGMSIRAG